MVADKLRSIGPLRVLAESLHSGLGAGNLGVVAARAGVGKSACLVQIVLESLLRGRKALHVALDHGVGHVRQWYDEILDEAGRRKLLDVGVAERLELERRRNIHSFRDRDFSAERLAEALLFLRENMDFEPQLIVIDGYDLSAASGAELSAIKQLAGQAQAEIWLSALTHRHEPPDPATGLPKTVALHAELISVVINLRPQGDKVLVELLKDHDEPTPGSPPLKLDPTSLLLVEQDD